MLFIDTSYMIFFALAFSFAEPNTINIIIPFLFLADEAATVRVTNLSEDTQESDLQELFRPFGQIARIYLAKDKITNQSKVFCHS